MRNSRPTCPLCKTSDSTLIEKTATQDIWNWYQQEWGAKFSSETIKQHSPTSSFDLLSCTACELHYWSPLISGSADFYAELTTTAAGYYTEKKWEFDQVKSLLKSDDRVLDVACGAGAFVRNIETLVETATGVDTNPSAVKEAQQAGLDVRDASILEYAQLHKERYSVVTAFQVVEHLDDIMPFVSAAFDCVAPGGTLFISVPNRHRRTLSQYEALEHPPHHLTRWSEQQISTLADRLGATIAEVVHEPMDKSQLVKALRQQELPAFLPKSLPAREFLIKAISRLLLVPPISFWMQSSSMQRKHSFYAHTTLAKLLKAG